MARLRITTYTRPAVTAPATPVDWWDKTSGATPADKKTLAGPRALNRATTTSGKTNYIVFELFRNNAAMMSYDADAAVVAVKAKIATYNTAHAITKTEVITNVAM